MRSSSGGWVRNNLRRPPPGPPEIPGLWLAGDCCDTGLPATLEAAARSGFGLCTLYFAIQAAGVLLRVRGRVATALVALVPLPLLFHAAWFDTVASTVDLNIRIGGSGSVSAVRDLVATRADTLRVSRCTWAAALVANELYL